MKVPSAASMSSARRKYQWYCVCSFPGSKRFGPVTFFTSWRTSGQTPASTSGLLPEPLVMGKKSSAGGGAEATGAMACGPAVVVPVTSEPFHWTMGRTTDILLFSFVLAAIRSRSTLAALTFAGMHPLWACLVAVREFAAIEGFEGAVQFVRAGVVEMIEQRTLPHAPVLVQHQADPLLQPLLRLLLRAARSRPRVGEVAGGLQRVGDDIEGRLHLVGGDVRTQQLPTRVRGGGVVLQQGVDRGDFLHVEVGAVRELLEEFVVLGGRPVSLLVPAGEEVPRPGGVVDVDHLRHGLPPIRQVAQVKPPA